MEKVDPRYEFRTFARSLGLVERKMRALSPVEKVRESAETYIISAENNENNTKIRDGKLDIKVLVDEKEGLEQWNPRLKAAFPLSAEQIEKDLGAAFGVSFSSLSQEAYSFEEFLTNIVGPQPELQAVNVEKRRFGFTIFGCIAEIAQVYINGALVHTAAIESTDIDAVLRACQETGLSEHENINYLKAMKRVTGLLPQIIAY